MSSSTSRTGNVPPLSFAERVTYASWGVGDDDTAQEAAAVVERENAHESNLAARMRAVRARPNYAPSRMAGLTRKQQTILGTLLEWPAPIRGIEADAARNAWAAGWRDWSYSGLYTALLRLEARGLVACDRTARPAVWSITDAGYEAIGRWLDAEEDWWEALHVIKPGGLWEHRATRAQGRVLEVDAQRGVLIRPVAARWSDDAWWWSPEMLRASFVPVGDAA